MKLGEWNLLRIERIKDVGAYLTDGIGFGETMDVLLPTRQIPDGSEVGDNVRVFLYRDSEDRLIATTHEPLICIGEIRRLKVKSVSDIGAFMDWGLSRDLFLPFKEQTTKVRQEGSYLVKLYVDKTGRLAASMKISDMLVPNDVYKKGDHVKGIVYNMKKDFGAFVALEAPGGDGSDDGLYGESDEMKPFPEYRYSGLIHSSEIYENLYVGDEVEVRIIKVREDGKTDLAMRDEIPQQMEKDAQMVYDIIKSYGGRLPFNDKADAALIKKEFGISKNAFKRAVGRLLKEEKILLKDGKILVSGK